MSCFLLFPGKEVFVGVGKRTNELGAQAVAEAFPEYAVSMVNFSKCEALHFKDCFNMAGKNVMAVAPGPDVQVVLQVGGLGFPPSLGFLESPLSSLDVG